VFDGRFTEATQIAQYAAREGIALAETSGDLTDLWYDHLDLRWKKSPTALAGMTTQRGLFVLETLAADRGMKVVYRGRHGVARNGSVAHSLVGPADLIAMATPGRDGSVWVPLLGRAIARCPVGRAGVARLESTTPAVGGATRDEPLFSWIIAPRSSAAPRV
jgi:hypothetical protein